MKTLICLALMMVLVGCGQLNLKSPYFAIDRDSDSQIFAYTDADVTVNAEGVESDDTTLIIIGVKDNTGADITDIFNNAMKKIEEIFHERQQVYKEWVK